MRYRLQLFIAILLMFTIWALRPSASRPEAHWLWVVRDVTDVQPAAPSDVLRGVRTNLSSALDRSGGGVNIPFALALEGWSWLTGDSLEALRWGGILLIGVAAAGVSRVASRRAPAPTRRILAVIFVIFPVLILVQPTDRLTFELRWARDGRTPDQPVITFFSESSPLGYYQHRYNLRAGMGLDLGWRAFSAAELADIASKIQPTGPVFLIAETYDHPGMVTITDYLSLHGRPSSSGTAYGDEIALRWFP